MGQVELAAMAKELRALSHLDGNDEFARYADPTSMTREQWIEAVDHACSHQARRHR